MKTKKDIKTPFEIMFGFMILLLIVSYVHMINTQTGMVKALGAIPAGVVGVISGVIGYLLGLKLIKFIKGKDQPRYKHDCSECKFLGIHQEYDLYWCQQGGYPTVIARFGNKGSDYLSGSWAATGPLAIARELASKAGYLVL